MTYFSLWKKNTGPIDRFYRLDPHTEVSVDLVQIVSLATELCCGHLKAYITTQKATLQFWCALVSNESQNIDHSYSETEMEDQRTTELGESNQHMTGGRKRRQEWRRESGLACRRLLKKRRSPREEEELRERL